MSGRPLSDALGWPSFVVLAAGLAFTLYLQTTIREGVFTQGDLAMKYLLTRQLAHGEGGPDLRLPGEAWVKELWSGGLHPFPFAVRRVGDREYLYYPVTFPLISALPHRWLGFRGLYLLPLVSTWVAWLAFVLAAKRYGLREPWCAAVLAVLVFATPLTFYSATFWEHTLAVALCFPALALALAPPGLEPPGAAASLGLGALLGAGAWFREEMLFLAGIAALCVALPPRWLGVGPLSVRRWHFIAGLSAAVALFVAGNLALYGMPLGVHATTFVSLFSQWDRSASAARFLAGSLRDHYLIGAAWLALLGGLWWRERWAAVARPGALLLICVAFCVAVPLLAHHEGGRQFGPRFLLVVFPLSALAGGLLMQRALHGSGWRLRCALLTPLALVAALGVHANTVAGEHYLRVNYQRRRLSYDAVRHSTPRRVAVSNEFVAQQLADLVGAKTFFLTTRAIQLKQLGAELAREGEPGLLYLCYPQYPCGPFSGLPRELTLYSGQRPFLRFEKMGRFDRYVIYQGWVLD